MATTPATRQLGERRIGGRSDRRANVQPYLEALGAGLITFVLLGGLYLSPYVQRHLRYPIGFDVPYYVVYAKQTAAHGIGVIRSVRVGTPVLLASLTGATRQDAFALVAWFPAVLTVVSALGAAAMVRVALRIRPIWIPVIGFLTWAAFGRNGMLNLHLDNLVNAALVLSAFAAALAFVECKRGGLAVTLLLVAAGYSHWTFYVFALAVYFVAVLLFTGRDLWRTLTGEGGSVGPAARLLAPAAASGILLTLPLVLTSFSRRPGVHLRRELLERRFILRLKDRYRYYAFPLAGLGALGTVTTPSPPARPEARRFFLWLMVAWVAVTTVAGIAQLTGFPTAGGRLLHYLFAVPILAGVSVWWLGSLLANRFGRVGKLGSVGVALVALAGFGALAWSLEASIRPRFSPSQVQQTSLASEYVTNHAQGRCIVYLLGKRQDYNSVRGALPVLRVDDARYFVGSAEEYRGAVETVGCAPSRASPVALILSGFNRDVYDQAAARAPDRVIAPGVLVLVGPIPRSPIGPVPPPISHSPLRVGGVALALLTLLFAVGSGWSAGLLPPDAVVRVSLAPGLGLASVMLAGLVWSAAGLPLSGSGAVGPSVLALCLGWAVAGARRLVPRPSEWDS